MRARPGRFLLRSAAPRRRACRRRLRDSARARRKALSRPSTARESVRAMIRKSGVLRASVAARIFSCHLGAGDDLLILHMAALFGHDLIFDVNGGDASALVLLHGADHVERIAVAGVGIGNYAERPRPGRCGARCPPSASSSAGRRRAAEQRRRCAKAGHVHGGKSGLLDDARGQASYAPGATIVSRPAINLRSVPAFLPARKNSFIWDSPKVCSEREEPAGLFRLAGLFANRV